MRPLSRHPAALAHRCRLEQTLGDVVHASLVRVHEGLVRSTGGAVFVAYGSLDMLGIGRVFYVILSDAPLARDSKWVLIFTWTSWAARSDILKATDVTRRLLRAHAN
jgi:hypothetical protein